jgi:hypothetical protein
VPWQPDRRYSPWLLNHEESLRLRQDNFGRSMILVAALVVIAEAMLPWDRYTPDIPALIHIVVAAAASTLLYFIWQADLRRKQQAFALAMADRGRRLLFLDPWLEPEEFAITEQLQGAHLLPLQRQMQAALKTGPGQSLHARVEAFYRNLPSTTHEGDRLGALSVIHPATFVTWGIAVALVVVCAPELWHALFGAKLFGTNNGLTLLPLLLLLYLYAARANTRFAFEHALFDWLRLG